MEIVEDLKICAEPSQPLVKPMMEQKKHETALTLGLDIYCPRGNKEAKRSESIFEPE